MTRRKSQITRRKRTRKRKTKTRRTQRKVRSEKLTKKMRMRIITWSRSPTEETPRRNLPRRRRDQTPVVTEAVSPECPACLRATRSLILQLTRKIRASQQILVLSNFLERGEIVQLNNPRSWRRLSPSLTPRHLWLPQTRNPQQLQARPSRQMLIGKK